MDGDDDDWMIFMDWIEIQKFSSWFLRRLLSKIFDNCANAITKQKTNQQVTKSHILKTVPGNESKTYFVEWYSL